MSEKFPQSSHEDVLEAEKAVGELIETIPGVETAKKTIAVDHEEQVKKINEAKEKAENSYLTTENQINDAKEENNLLEKAKQLFEESKKEKKFSFKGLLTNLFSEDVSKTSLAEDLKMVTHLAGYDDDRGGMGSQNITFPKLIQKYNLGIDGYKLLVKLNKTENEASKLQNGKEKVSKLEERSEIIKTFLSLMRKSSENNN